MTEESKEAGEVINEPGGIEPQGMRKVRPAFAFLANFLGFGLGYVYAGELRLAISMIAASVRRR